MQKHNLLHQGLVIVLGGCALTAATCASALNYQIDDLRINVETALSAGIAIRGQNANKDLIGKANNAGTTQTVNATRGSYSVNSDDGNLAFPDAGDVFFTQLKATTDLTLKWGEWAIFARGNYRFDPLIEHRNVFDSFDYANDGSRTRTTADKHRRENSVDDALAHDAQLLDLYLSYNTNIDGHNAAVRVGRQVLNWGESTFIRHGINSIIPVDARQARGPGAEVKEIFRPFGMVWGSIGLTQYVSLEAFYQFQWQKTIADPSGSYFSTADAVGDGSTVPHIGYGRCNEHIPAGVCVPNPPNIPFAIAPFGPGLVRSKNKEPENGGQYGARLTFVIPQLNYTELSLYGMNYHSRLPFFSGRKVAAPTDRGNPATARYFLDYPEDIELYGVSFNSYITALNVSIQGEYSLKHNQPLAIANTEIVQAMLDVPATTPKGAPIQTYTTKVQPVGYGETFPGYQRLDVHQLDLGLTKVIGPSWVGADQIIFLAEVAGMYVDDMPSTADVPFKGSATYLPNQVASAAAVAHTPAQDRAGYADPASWGYRLRLQGNYVNVFNMFQLSPFVTYFQDVTGNSPSPVGNFLEGRKQSTLGVKAAYLSNWEAGMSYTFFWGGRNTNADPDVAIGQRGGGYTNNLLSDRDFLNMFIRYTF